MSLGTRISLINLGFISLVLTGFIVAIVQAVSGLAERKAIEDVTDRTQLIGALLEASDRDLRTRTTLLSKIFRSDLIGEFQLDPALVDLAGTQAPSLRLDGQLLNMDTSSVDRFTAATGAVATIFAKSGDDFIRVTTSLKNDKGLRVVGTRLDHTHPGYTATMDGRSYIGLASLFGRQYMTHYDPIRDSTGKVVGLLFVGLDFSEYVAEIRTTIKKLTIGETGYFYVLDARPGRNYGHMVIHPTAEGKSFLDVKDANGAPVIKSIMDKGNGVIRYAWSNKDSSDSSPREKVVAFMTIKGWDWIIAGGTHVDEYTADVRGLRNVYAALGAAIVLLTAGVTYRLMRRMVILPLADLSRSADRVAQGDLTVRLISQRPDEIGRLVEAINRIGSGLTHVVGSVRQGAEGLAAASSEIAQGNHDLSVRTEQQASALEQTASLMEQLSSQVKQNADSAHQANQLAASASSTAAHGGEAMLRVVETMKSINESSRRIADIVSVIDAIAFQTNILALNAAVEAARAGEQGRGFAVVASEVRSLAGRSAEAAKEIKLLVGASVERVAQGSTLIDDAGATMDDIVASIKRVTEIVGEISAASSEQSAGVSQVGHAVSQMDESTQQNAAMVEQVAAAASSLKSQAAELVDTVAVFRLAPERSAA